MIANQTVAGRHPAVALRTTTLDLGVTQGSTGIEAGMDVFGEGKLSYKRNYRGAVVAEGEHGRWKAAIQQGSTGTLTKSLDYSVKEGNTAIKVALKKIGTATWKWKASTETVGEFPLKASKFAESRFDDKNGDKSGDKGGDKPLIVTASLGVVEKDLRINAGVKATDGDVRLRAGVHSGGRNNSWGLDVETASKGKPGSWKLTLNTGN